MAKLWNLPKRGFMTDLLRLSTDRLMDEAKAALDSGAVVSGLFVVIEPSGEYVMRYVFKDRDENKKIGMVSHQLMGVLKGAGYSLKPNFPLKAETP